MTILNSNTVEVKRTFNTTPEKIFAAISDGVLFRTCGGKTESIQVDFREGGNWTFTCNHNDVVAGKFIQIIPNKLISFSWPDGSTVSINLTEQGNSTLMHLFHTNIATEANAKDFDWGWRNGINDFSPCVGRSLTIERSFGAPMEKVYSIFSAKDFFAQTGSDLDSGIHDFRTGGKFSFKNSKGILSGEFTDISPKRIAFTWNGVSPVGPTGETLVIIDFLQKDANTTIVKLTHSGFPSEEQAKIHNGGWTSILDFLANK